MAEYIKRNLAKAEFTGNFQDEYPVCQIHALIDCVPAADVRENVKGKWIDGQQMGFDGSLYWYRECDQCGYKRQDDNPDRDSKFCPNCGADMRGVNPNE